MTEGGAKWLNEAEARAWRGFQQMNARLTGFLARDLSAHSELSYADYAVLVVLTDEDSGAMRLFELAHKLGWEKSRASHQVARMAARRLVEKRRCTHDRRGSYVEVTEEGRARLASAAPGHVKAVRRVFVDRLSPEQLGQLEDLSEVVMAAIEAVEEGERSL
jgi:DNA-binding MarR family transcriptional regulator